MYTLRGKQKYQVTNVRVKSKIVTFLVRKLFLTQFITRPNLASSVANNVRRFFSVLIFPETTSNYYLYQNPFKQEDIAKGKLERRHEICKFWDVSLSHYPLERLRKQSVTENVLSPYERLYLANRAGNQFQNEGTTVSPSSQILLINGLTCRHGVFRNI